MNKYFAPLIILLLFSITSCLSDPQPSGQDTSGTQDTAATVTNDTKPQVTNDTKPTVTKGIALDKMKDDDVVVQFATVAITKEAFIHTKSEIEIVVDELNKITYDHDYTRWLEYTSQEYRDEFSNREVLDQVSASLPTKGVRLRSLQDYFRYVFVPSRQNMRVDDIQFVTPTRVYVIMEINPSSPAAIYILEKTEAGWKLVPKNQ